MALSHVYSYCFLDATRSVFSNIQMLTISIDFPGNKSTSKVFSCISCICSNERAQSSSRNILVRKNSFCEWLSKNHQFCRDEGQKNTLLGGPFTDQSNQLSLCNLGENKWISRMYAFVERPVFLTAACNLPTVKICLINFQVPHDLTYPGGTSILLM